MLKFVSDNFFDYDADIMINTVNCVGVMGKGVALEFKSRFPEMFEDYVNRCNRKELKPGFPYVWHQKSLFSKEIEIINFPTKNDWRNDSKYEYIFDGLKWLSEYLHDKKDKIVTIPALGCGNGGLNWEIVSSMIYDNLNDSPAKIFVFEPQDLVKIGVITNNSSNYPETLRNFTDKNLYYFPQNSAKFEYDFTVICSTTPQKKEMDAVADFLQYCILNQYSVLLGGTDFEKRIAFKFFTKGLMCGCFLPSGIYKSAKKISSKTNQKSLTLLSLGNPNICFDKKEFLNSVFARLHISNNAVFFTDRLDWYLDYKINSTLQLPTEYTPSIGNNNSFDENEKSGRDTGHLYSNTKLLKLF